MKKTVFALSAALSFLALGTSAALATTTLTGTSQPPLGVPIGVDDALQLWNNNTSQIAGFPILLSDEATCAHADSGIGGCSFDKPAFTPSIPNPITVTPNGLMANQIALFYLPGTTTIDAVFALGCSRNAATGLCTDTPSFTILTASAAHPFDFSILPSVNVTIGFVGTELPGTTWFDVSDFINVAGTNESQHITARLVLTNDVPEPLTLSLFGAGLVGAAAMRRRKQK